MPTKFDLRLVRYVPGGARVDVLATETITATLPGDDPGIVRADLLGAVYGALPELVELALEYWDDDEAAWVEPPDCRFLLNTDDDDDTDPAAVHGIQAAALIPWKFGKAIVENPPDLDDLVDGHRPFNSATAGAIIKTIIDEEQALGWAPELVYDFDADLDSDGVPWANEITIQYTPGTTAAKVLDNLIAQGMVEIGTEGRTLHLWNPDHGTDLTTGDNPTQVGRAATARPSKRSLDDLITDATLFGDNGFTLEVNNPSAVTGLGALRVAIQQGGVSDPGTAALLVQAQLTRGESIRQQLTATEWLALAATEDGDADDETATARSLPWKHYRVGDWVHAWFRGEWVRVKVAELVVQKHSNGSITASPILNDRFLDLLSRLAKRTSGIVGGAVAGGSGAQPSTGDDRRAPKAPVGLVVSSSGYWSDGGVPLAQLSAEWTPVTQGENDVAIEVGLYQLWGRPDDGGTESVDLTSVVEPAASWSPFTPGTDWLIKVRAQSKNGVWGEFSDEEPVTMEQPTFALGEPSPPVVSSSNSVVEVVWPGTFDTDPPSLPPQHFRQMNVEMGVSEVGDYALVGTLFAGSERTSLIGLGVGSEWWFRLVAVDRLGRLSVPSASTHVTVLGVDGADLIVDSVKANSIESGAIIARHIGADVSGAIDITATQGFSVVVGSIEQVADDLDGTAGELVDLRQRYDYTPDALVVRQPGASTRIELDDDSIVMFDGATALITLTGGVVNATQFVGGIVTLGAHQFQAAPAGVSGTVIRAY